MNKRTLLVILTVTILALLVGIQMQSNGTGTTSFANDKWLDFTPDAINEVVIESHDSKVTLKRTNTEWQVVERGLYPANKTKLTELVGQLFKSQILELKTKLPKHYAKLGLQGIEPDSNSVQIQLNVGGDTLTVLIGNTDVAGTFVKKGDEIQTVLINEIISVDSSPKNWIDEGIFEQSIADVERLSVSFMSEHDSSNFVISTQGDAEDFVLVEPSVNKKLAYDSILTGLVRNIITAEANDVLANNMFEETKYTLLASYELTIKEEIKPLSMQLFQSEQTGYWLKIENRPWLFKISEYVAKQLVKPLDQYLQSSIEE